MTRRDEAPEFGTKAADNAGRQRGYNPLARRRLPALAAIAHHIHADTQILHQHILVTAKARPRRNRGFQLHLRGYHQLVAHRSATALAALLADRLRCPLFHPRRLVLELRARRQSLQTRDLVLQRNDLGVPQRYHCGQPTGIILKRRDLATKRRDLATKRRDLALQSARLGQQRAQYAPQFRKRHVVDRV